MFFWRRKKKEAEKAAEAVPAAPPQPKVPTAVIETDKGVIQFELFTEKAPQTTAHFIKLAQRKFYDGLTFHRVVPGFVVQGGCPRGDGTGGCNEKIKLETHPDLKHDAIGTVAMARASDPHSASSQFYITLGAHSSLDGQYAVFGKVSSGLEVVQKISKGDRINTIRVL
ncbi:MAG: peptidylprolyl isomerase [Acidobacteriia bacterium]|nr:peptidylprolyl isomerase [Terriglobia bacterium]